jgi:xanthine dehydrogenase accessory factor
MAQGSASGAAGMDAAALHPMDAAALHAKALALIAEKRRFAWAMVIHAVGSTPQKAGARAIFEAAGPIHGTLGGGCLEAECRRRALRALDTGEASHFELRLDEIEGWDDGLVCGGKVRVFIDPDPAREAERLRALVDAAAHRRRGVLATVIADGCRGAGATLWCGEDAWPRELPEEVLRAVIARGKPVLHAAGSGEYFLEPYLPPPRLLIAGGGHIGRATAAHAARAGFEVTVVDDRPAFASKAHIPEAQHVLCGDIAETLAGLPKDRDTYAVIVTRGHRHDGEALAACLGADLAFLGMIGSRRKALLIKRHLVESGRATQAQVDRVHSPIGLDIGAETIDEIAISIVAQLIAVRRRGGAAEGGRS